jgi:hypothetical protein
MSVSCSIKRHNRFLVLCALLAALILTQTLSPASFNATTQAAAESRGNPSANIVQNIVPDQAAQARVTPQILQIAAQNPDQWISVIIQKANGSTQVESLVEQLGGAITKYLRIINAFAAEMSAGSAVELAQSHSVRWVSLDAPVQPTTVGGSTVRDDFSNVSYTNNKGTLYSAKI